MLSQEFSINIIEKVLEYLDDAALMVIAVTGGVKVDVASSPVGSLDIFNDVGTAYNNKLLAQNNIT